MAPMCPRSRGCQCSVFPAGPKHPSVFNSWRRSAYPRHFWLSKWSCESKSIRNENRRLRRCRPVRKAMVVVLLRTPTSTTALSTAYILLLLLNVIRRYVASNGQGSVQKSPGTSKRRTCRLLSSTIPAWKACAAARCDRNTATGTRESPKHTC